MTRFQKWLLLGSSLAAGVTGLLYWWMKHMMEPVTEWAAINHPLQPWVLKAHILAAPVLVFAAGLIASDHIARHLKKARSPGRWSGMTTLWLLAPMVLSGYLIQTITHPAGLVFLSWFHLGTGGIYLMGLGIHQWVFKRRKGSEKAEQGKGRGAGAEEERRGDNGEPRLKKAPTPRPGPSSLPSGASLPGSVSRPPRSPV